MHEAMVDLGDTADEVASTLAMAGVRGWVEDAEGDANPVCLYLNAIIGRRCRRMGASILCLGSGGKFVAQVRIEKPCQVFSKRFARGEYSRMARKDEGVSIPMPWGYGVLKPIGCEGVEWARGQQGLGGLAILSAWAKRRMSEAGIASGMVCGGLLFYPASEWGMVASELPYAKKILLWAVTTCDPKDDEWTVEFHLNTTQEGRAYLLASHSDLLWPANAVVDCRKGVEKDTVLVRTAGGDWFTASLTSVNGCRTKGADRPLMADALEQIPSDDLPF